METFALKTESSSYKHGSRSQMAKKATVNSYLCVHVNMYLFISTNRHACTNILPRYCPICPSFPFLEVNVWAMFVTFVQHLQLPAGLEILEECCKNCVTPSS